MDVDGLFQSTKQFFTSPKNGTPGSHPILWHWDCPASLPVLTTSATHRNSVKWWNQTQRKKKNGRIRRLNVDECSIETCFFWELEHLKIADLNSWPWPSRFHQPREKHEFETGPKGWPPVPNQNSSCREQLVCACMICHNLHISWVWNGKGWKWEKICVHFFSPKKFQGLWNG